MLITPHKETKYIMRIVKPLKYFSVLIEGLNKSTKNETKSTYFVQMYDEDVNTGMFCICEIFE